MAEAARAFGIDSYIGSDVETFLVALADALAPDGGLTEDAVARRAALETIEECFGEFGVTDDGLMALDRLTPASVDFAVQVFASNYVFERIIQALSARIEARAFSAARAAEVERIVREYIRSEVRFEAAQTDMTVIDWAGPEGHLLLGEIFERSFAILEAAAPDDNC